MQQQQYEWKRGLLLLFIIGMLCAMPAEASVTVQTVTGTVTKDGQPLDPGAVLENGDAIQTGAGSEVVLQTEDGSFFFVRENSQFAVVASEFSAANRTRMYHFSVSQGTIVAEVAKLAFEASTDSVTIETPIGTTEATTNEDRGTTFQVTYEPMVPVWEIYNFKGIVIVNQTGEGVSNLAGLISEESGVNEGVTFPINVMGAVVEMEVIPEDTLVIAKSSMGITDLVAMLGNYIGMEVTQLDEENQAPITLYLPNEEEEVLRLEQKGQRVFIATAPANVVLGEAEVYLHGQFKFFEELGTFWMWDLCDCGGVDWRPGVTPPGRPPVVPPSPGTRPPESTGSPTKP